jgi:hypothetical protein
MQLALCCRVSVAGSRCAVLNDASVTCDPNATSNKIVKLSVPVLLLLAAISATLTIAQVQPNEPTKQEIAEAHRSKSGEGGTFIPGVRWEKWRIKEIRGWSLRFKRVSEKSGLGLLTRKYRAVAQKNGSCVEYQITDTMLLTPGNVQIKPILVVEPSGVTACR